MTLALPKSRLPRRVNTDADLAAATRVAEGMYEELDELILRRKKWEENYPSLRDPGYDGEVETPPDLPAAHDKLVFRIARLQSELLGWSKTASDVVVKQIEARHKSGELVSVRSVAAYLTQMALLANKYTPKADKPRQQREADEIMRTFLAANPAAALEAGANVREQQEMEELQGAK